MAGIEVDMLDGPVPGDREPGASLHEAGRPEAAGAGAPPVDPASPDGPDGTPADPAGAPGAPQAARGTTIALVAALALVVVMSGVLGAVAVLMTRNPDAPPLSRTSVRPLLTPIHFAPVTGIRPAPCDGTDAVPDDKGTSCYQLDPGVTVKTVQKLEELPESGGDYSLRVVLSPSDRDEIAQLTRETVKQQLALVVGEKVVAAPRVAQEITQDSLSIAGFTKAQADSLMTLLIGSASPPPATPPVPSGGPSGSGASQPGATQPGATQPGATQPGATQPGATQPGAPQPGATQPGATQPGGTKPGATQPGATPPGVTQPGALSATGGRQGATHPAGSTGWLEGGTRRFATCKDATDNGYGPYTKGRHKEYAWYQDKDHDGVACDPDDL
ncbi:excalibur calcium-binding domain-containing protein [Microbispora sp. NPDC049125]|uniref:excalibur calcium-binding domain-containing protein n=1 Tax=Microbispora sp. NPDC049125 TaxID=3154929 RepID=UPI003465BD16